MLFLYFTLGLGLFLFVLFTQSTHAAFHHFTVLGPELYKITSLHLCGDFASLTLVFVSVRGSEKHLVFLVLLV